MQWPFEFDDIAIEISPGGHTVPATVEGIAIVDVDWTCGTVGEWCIDEIMILAMRGSTPEYVTITHNHYLFTQLMNELRKERDDIDEQYVVWFAEQRAGNHADTQRDEIVSRELLS